jgi:uroporphyrin-III C-methyltransferase
LATQLIAHGLPADHPAILAEAVSTPDQRVDRSTISDLANRLLKDVGPSPALIVYGPLAELD